MVFLDGLNLFQIVCLKFGPDAVQLLLPVCFDIHQLISQLFLLFLQPDDIVLCLGAESFESVHGIAHLILFLVQLLSQLSDFLLVYIVRR